MNIGFLELQRKKQTVQVEIQEDDSNSEFGEDLEKHHKCIEGRRTKEKFN